MKAFRQFFLEGIDKAEAWLKVNEHLKIRGFLPKKRAGAEASEVADGAQG